MGIKSRGVSQLSQGTLVSVEGQSFSLQAFMQEAATAFRQVEAPPGYPCYLSLAARELQLSSLQLQFLSSQLSVKRVAMTSIMPASCYQDQAPTTPPLGAKNQRMTGTKIEGGQGPMACALLDSAPRIP